MLTRVLTENLEKLRYGTKMLKIKFKRKKKRKNPSWVCFKMFEDRQQAGFLLAQKLEQFADKKDVLVLGLARGGVVVAKVISTFLNVPFAALVIKKIDLPITPKLTTEPFEHK